ncbi:MAG TPA: hypothetical protein VFA18_03465 [Gemmataceae bacterium]|nr:hypothetical protein [Gemmataceae bacterium]
MVTFTGRTFVMALTAALALCTTAAAQSRFDPDPYKSNSVVITTTPSPYWGYSWSPYGDAIRAEGDFLIKVEQARMLREKVRQEKLVTYRQKLEYVEWEREFRTEMAHKERERIEAREREYAVKSPTMGEIMEGTPLNTLLDQLAEKPVRFADGSTAVDQEALQHIHVTVDGKGNVGMLKGERIFWPQLLLRPDFAELRKNFERLLKKAKAELDSGISSQVDVMVLHDLQQQVTEFDARAKHELLTGTFDPECNDRNYVEARRFLNQVRDTLEGLKQPEAAYYLKSLQGKTVAELVAYMHKHGIRFAPGTFGCERYYKMLHSAFADEAKRLQGSAPAAEKES